MHARVATLVLILGFMQLVSSFDSTNVVYTIISQSAAYHARAAQELKRNIVEQVQDLVGRNPIVHLTHEDFPVPLSWTITPLFRLLLARYESSDVRWVVFLEPHTVVHCDRLMQTLRAADNQSDIKWMGYPLRDDNPTIIHHFEFFENLKKSGGFVYPNFASGFAMRTQLIKSFYNQLEKDTRRMHTEIIRDPAFELAREIYGDHEDQGPLLTADPGFCIRPSTDSKSKCATYPKLTDVCGRAIPEETIFFAVKTWSGFRSTRAETVKRTWGKHVTNLVFYSDVTDPSLPSLSVGVPNTLSGHCLKTMNILKMAVDTVKTMPFIQWIFLADDDTVLGVQRLCEVLSCYSGGQEFTVLGERYGFGDGRREDTTKGYYYDYITLGGGSALSVAAAARLSRCACAGADSADDMTLGACARTLNLTLTHSPLFHQERPQDYSPDLLTMDRPVSFHHCGSEADAIYRDWFQRHDETDPSIKVTYVINDEL